VSTTEKCS